jgi:5,10-methylenetetrahydromethanopterin reductase
MLEAAIEAERNGFECVFIPEHYYDRDAPIVLGAIANATKKIRLGTGVINPFTRYPSLIAMTIASLDEISGGRAFLGLGSGGVIGSLEHGIPNEFQGQEFGYPLGHLRECVEIVRKILTVSEPVSWEGKFYSLQGVKLNFKPLQARVPIYFGQQGPKMMQLAGKIADGVIITLCCTVPYIQEVIRQVNSSKQKRRSEFAGDAVDYAGRIIVSLSDEDPRKAIREAKQLVGRVFIHPGAKPVAEISGIELDVRALKNAIDRGRSDLLYDLVPDEVVQMTTASGSKREVLGRLEEYRAAGLTLPLIVPVGRNYLETIRIFARG